MRSYRRPGRYATSGARGSRRIGVGGRRGGHDDGLSMGTGWTVFSYLISGMLAYGGIGWVIGALHAHFAAFPDRHAGRARYLDGLDHLQVRSAT